MLINFIIAKSTELLKQCPVRLVLGRADGLGNRVEEIALLSAFASRNKRLIIIYFWNNLLADAKRVYPIKLNCDNVAIMLLPHWLWLVRKPVKHFFSKISSDIRIYISEQSHGIHAGASTIKPIFKLHWDRQPVLGLHIRGTDRISLNNWSEYPDHFMKSNQELEKYITSSIEYAIRSRTKHVFVCGDELPAVEQAIQALKQAGKIPLRPRVAGDNTDEYYDFFALSQCEEVIMASKFSSFCLMAALIGGARVKSFGCSPELLQRFNIQHSV